MSLRHRRRRSLFFGGSDAYAVASLNPNLVFDFAAELYRTSSLVSTFDNSLTYTGASSKTMVDSDGLVKWAPHNSMLYSEEFNNAAWTKGDSSISANATVAPDGSLTADKLIDNTNTAQHRVYGNKAVISNLTYTYSVFAKAAEKSAMVLSFAGVALGTPSFDYRRAEFDLSAGTVTFTPINGSASIAEVGNGWYLCSITITPLASESPRMEITLSNGLGAYTYEGDGTSGIYIWGAHRYRSDLGGMVDNPDRGDSYVPTTSAAVYLPRRGHHIYNGSTWVNEGIQIESEARTNLLAESNDFATTWTLVNGALTAADATGPDGAASMTLLNDDSATGTGEVYVDYAVTVSTTTAYTFSVFVKADQLAFVALGTENFTTPASGETFFNLTTGASATVAAGHTATIENFGGGIYRCAITFTTDAADTTGNLRIYVSDGDTDITVDLDGTSSVHIYGAQFE